MSSSARKVMNLFAAAQDVAVDGLAVDLLGARELGMGNAAQVCGYKLGGWTTGGLLVWQLEAVGGWPGVFHVMALAALAGFALVLVFREPPSREVRAAAAGSWRMRDVLVELGRALAVPRTAWLLLLIGTYKLGESMPAGWSYSEIFATGTVLSVLFLGLLLPFRRAPAPEEGVPSSAIG